jgi:hypothetical protein
MQKKVYYIFIATVFLLSTMRALAQTVPVSESLFFSKLNYNNVLPTKLLSGRTLLVYDVDVTNKDLIMIQQSLASTGIDASLALEVEKIMGGHEVTKALTTILQKREISNLIFFRKGGQQYRCIATAFNGKPSLISAQQSAWQASNYSLSALLQQLNREALANFKKQNLLINEEPETELVLSIYSGSCIESFTIDLRADRTAVRLSGRSEEDEILKNICKQYPFKMEFVADSISDVELRQKGFWYVLNSVCAHEPIAKELLQYPAKVQPTLPQTTQQATIIDEKVYKFYFKKLEFDNVYVGKQWDADKDWTQALTSLFQNLRKELNIQ